MGASKALPELLVGTVAFKKLINRHIDIQGRRDMKPIQAEGITLIWPHVQHRDFCTEDDFPVHCSMF